MLTPFLLAATAPNPDEEAIREAASRYTPFVGGETAWILGAMLAVAGAVFIWAIFLRKRPETQRGSFVITRTRPEDRAGSSGRRRRRKRKPDHPENLPRNPTLAEIGGLPPLRPDDPEPSEGDGAAEAQR